jgi:hypothetical protein
MPLIYEYDSLISEIIPFYFMDGVPYDGPILRAGVKRNDG